MKIIRKIKEKLLIESFIKDFKKLAKKKEQLKKRFSFVLTGGKSPKKLYKKLSKEKINWKNIDFFIGDERFVKEDSKNSNIGMCKKHLLNKIKISKKINL